MKPLITTLAACALLAACTAEPPAATDAAETPVASATTSACADDGPTFPITGICQSRAVNYLDPKTAPTLETLDGCSWEMAETAFGPDEALLYRALSCNGATTALEFRGGAQSAALGYAASALASGDVRAEEPVKIFVTDPADPQKAIRDLFPSIPEAERASCVIAAAGDGAPAGALEIRLTPEARAKLPQDEPVSGCGPYGFDEDSATYWRIAQGYAWHFNLGQDMPDFDPASFVLFAKGADGSWAPKP